MNKTITQLWFRKQIYSCQFGMQPQLQVRAAIDREYQHQCIDPITPPTHHRVVKLELIMAIVERSISQVGRNEEL
ncbi:hypothetical protein [Yersinia rochesterensis]|uniref:hypothetical protein n=1 Tax=Yersinia rochesterensis TaxID=1604335 RepID=UPI0011A9CE73|nr:hypothetical protein [Yersinia rochesterensis]